MSKRVQSKIQVKHSDMLKYTSQEGFTLLLAHTVAVVDYQGVTQANNFIALVDGTYILYSLKQEKNHTSCSTIFKLKPKTLKKYYKDDTFKFLQKSYEKHIEEYIN